MAGALLAMALGEVMVGLSEWLALRRLDLGAPSIELQQRLDRLQWRRQRQTRLLLSCSVLLWLPLLAVLLKGLFGGDLLIGLHDSVWWVNLGVGVAFIPLSLGAAAWWRRRFEAGARTASAGDGDSWTRARAELDARLAFESDAERDPESAMQSHTFPEDLHTVIATLRRRLLIGILACAAGLLAIGLFNAAHGGLPQFIVPGVLINLWLVSQMAPSIQLRLALNPLPGGLPAFRARLEPALRLRRRFAIGGVIALPMAVLMLVQVVAKAALGMDVFAVLGRIPSATVLALAPVCVVLLFAQARQSAVDPLTVTGFAIDTNGDGTAENFTAGQTASIAGVGTLTIGTNGAYTFTPLANYAGPVPVATYSISDGNGGTDSATLTLTMGSNTPPVATDNSAPVTEDTPVSGNVLTDGTADSDPDGNPLTVTGFAIDTNGDGTPEAFTAGQTATIPGVGTLTIGTNGAYTFTPAPDYTGAISVASYTISDGLGGTDTATLTLGPVGAVNDPPVDGNETNSVTDDSTLTVADGAAGDLLNNATDIDAGVLSITGYSIVLQPYAYSHRVNRLRG